MRFNINLEDVNYIKILCKDSEGAPRTLKAAIKKFDERELIACSKFEENLLIKTPQEITLSFVCTDGLYRTKTKLLSIENADPYLILIIEPPQGLEYQQNREYFRVPVIYPCKYIIKVDDSIISHKGTTFDLSANGVSIILSEHAITTEDSYLEIDIEGIEIRTKVKYIRSEKVENGYRLSFKYTQITNQDRDYISKVCIQKQLEHKRHTIS